MKHGNRYERHRLCAFAGFDGKTYDALAIRQRRGLVRVDYMIQEQDGNSRLVRAYLDTHEAKARLTEAGSVRMGALVVLAFAVLAAAAVLMVRGFA